MIECFKLVDSKGFDLLIFANNYGFPITLSCLAATHFSHHTLNSNNGIVHPPRYLRSRYRSAFHNHNKSFQITLTFHATFEVSVKNQ